MYSEIIKRMAIIGMEICSVNSTTSLFAEVMLLVCVSSFNNFDIWRLQELASMVLVPYLLGSMG